MENADGLEYYGKLYLDIFCLVTDISCKLSMKGGISSVKLVFLITPMILLSYD